MEQLLREAIDRFNAKVEADEKMQRELEGITKRVQIDVENDTHYNFILDDKKISGPYTGTIENPDIRIISDSETVRKLFNKEMGPMKALATKKLQIKASLEDMLRLRRFF